VLNTSHNHHKESLFQNKPKFSRCKYQQNKILNKQRKMQQKGKCFKTQNPKIRAQKSKKFISCYKIMKNEGNSRFVSINKSNTKSTAIPQ
jgi:hypothetical protein